MRVPVTLPPSYSTEEKIKMADTQEIICDGDSCSVVATPKPSAGKRAGKGKKRAAAETQTLDATESQENSVPAPKKTKAAGKGKGKIVKEAKQIVESVKDQLPADGAVGITFVEKSDKPVPRPQVKVVKRVVKQTKKLDVPASLAKYKERVSSFPDDKWAELNGKWLSDYKLFTNEPSFDSSWHHGSVLMEVAPTKGAVPKGLCAENMKKGKKVVAEDGSISFPDKHYLQSVLPDGTARDQAQVIYIGGMSRFTDLPASDWAMVNDDHVYLAPSSAPPSSS